MTKRTNTLNEVKNFITYTDRLNYWPSPRTAAAEAAANIEGCERVLWAGENILSIDGEIYEVTWMNRKHTALLVVPATPTED